MPNFLHHARKASSEEPRTGASIFAQSCHAKAVTHAISLARVLVSLTKSGIFALVRTFLVPLSSLLFFNHIPMYQSPIAGFAAFTGATALVFDADVRGASAGSQSLQFFLRYLVTGIPHFSPFKPMVHIAIFSPSRAKLTP